MASLGNDGCCVDVQGGEQGSSQERTRTAITAALRNKLKELMASFDGLRQRLQQEYRSEIAHLLRMSASVFASVALKILHASQGRRPRTEACQWGLVHAYAMNPVTLFWPEGTHCILSPVWSCTQRQAPRSMSGEAMHSIVITQDKRRTCSACVCWACLREVVERRVYTVTGKAVSEDEVERMIETGESETIFQKAILEQGRGHVRTHAQCWS